MTKSMRRFSYALGILLLFGLSRFHKDDPIVHYKSGRAAYFRGDYDQAIAEYGKAIALNPRLKQAYVSRGVAYWKKADYNRSIADENQALQIDPNDAYAWADLAGSQCHLHNYSEGLTNTKKALEINPSLSFARFNLGLIYATMENWDQAKKEYEIAFVNSPGEDLKPHIEQAQLALKEHPQSVALKKALAMLQKPPFP